MFLNLGYSYGPINLSWVGKKKKSQIVFIASVCWMLYNLTAQFNNTQCWLFNLWEPMAGRELPQPIGKRVSCISQAQGKIKIPKSVLLLLISLLLL